METVQFLEADRKSIHHFYQALMGDGLYFESDEDNQRWEHFLIDWLNGGLKGYDDLKELFFETFQPIFQCHQNIYRGMMVEKGTKLLPKRFASFTTEKSVAESFAYYNLENSNEHDSYFIEMKPERALDLVGLLGCLHEKTGNEDMKVSIEQWSWECEIIAPLTQEVLNSFSSRTYDAVDVQTKDESSVMDMPF